MAMDITGIANENEFYTHHYLSAILENDLKDIFSQWKQKEDDEGILQPYTKLRSLRKEFFNRLSLLERERNVEERLNVQRAFISQLLSELGYEYHAQTVELDDNGSIPLAGGINRADGSPELWIIEVSSVDDENADPLELHFLPEQYPADDEIQKLPDLPMEEILTRQVFGRSEPPRWVILISFTQIILLDRTKWHEKRLLRFDVREILDRRETSTLQAMSALLHRDSICPKDGMPLLDTLDENSHKHAFAVSEDLKYSLREAIELLGNEAVYYLRETLHEKIYGRDMAGQLTRECLRYMYRMLFLFYIEARPELGYLPDKSEEYRKGYSLESLRDLEMIKLTTDESRNSFYIHESIQILFNLLYNGFQPRQLNAFGSPDHNIFRISPLRSHLFDSRQTPLLNRVKLRNFILQRIIELMSLSRPTRGRNNRRGRISYSQLGINQLGAVYEALLSYQGFFAENDLYEVKKAGEQHNVLETAYFVKPEDLEQYTEEERVFNGDGALVKYDKGTFIYRLAGRDREKSASYYTPEVLTRCLVKYALKELLKDKTADEVLELTVCEPAMGSAAFLNEAVNQLAKAYLDLKQKETEQIISHDAYTNELQKAKMYIADNNVYGVDLNPVAVELAEVSLWLNTIYEGAFVPWFGMQLVCGNSLIGARRQVFNESLLKKKQTTDPLWLDSVPERVMPGEKREKDTVYHFMLPDRGMADYNDKVIKGMAADEIKAINEWRKEFTMPFSKSEIDQLKQLSNAVDKLYKRHAEMQRIIDDRTTDPLPVFGQKAPKDNRQPTTTEFKDHIYHQEMFSRDVRNSSPYRRLKLVMDYWCALWFWPIEKADLLPSRAEFLFDLTLVLEGNLYDSNLDENGQQLLFPDTRPKQMSLSMMDEFGYVNVDKLCEENKRFGLVRELAEKYRYLHWELEFADLFESRGGFDLFLGNPPWIRIQWNEGDFLGDFEPLFILKDFNSAKRMELLKITIESLNIYEDYLNSYVESQATQNFLNAFINYPELVGLKANLYKCFLPCAWYCSSNNGYIGFVHDQGIFDDQRGGDFRTLCYKKLRYWFRFQNEKKLFNEVGNEKKFEVSIFASSKNNVEFDAIVNLFHPSTIDKSYNHSGTGPISGVKDSKNDWELNGHKKRIINVDENLLEVFRNLYDDPETPVLQARMPTIHSVQIVEVLKKLAFHKNRLDDLKNEFFATIMFDETASEKNGIIKRKTIFPDSIDKLILSGPHISVANPLFQTPKVVCNTHRAYDSIDLTSISNDYLPRTNYLPACDAENFKKRIQKVPWVSNKLVTDFYRIVHRKRLNLSQERTFQPAICPPRVVHIIGVVSTTFKTNWTLLDIAFTTSSIIFDFFIKITGRGDFVPGSVKQIPLINNPTILAWARPRVLMLNCLTDYYSDLWLDCWATNYNKDSWTKVDLRLNNNLFKDASSQWMPDGILRTDFERRHALIEIDVLSAMALGLDLDHLKTIYRLQFPVLIQNENNTWFDQRGRIVFTTSKSLPGVGFTRSEYNDIKNIKSGTVVRKIIDDTMPGGPVERTITYVAPFDRCDREKDYEVVWAEFERRFKEQEKKL